MDEKVRLNLQDFAAVIIINLLISLFVALFFVPSVIEKIALVRSRGYSGRGAKRKRMTIRFTPFLWKDDRVCFPVSRVGDCVYCTGFRFTGLSLAREDER